MNNTQYRARFIYSEEIHSILKPVVEEMYMKFHNEIFVVSANENLPSWNAEYEALHPQESPVDQDAYYAFMAARYSRITDAMNAAAEKANVRLRFRIGEDVNLIMILENGIEVACMLVPYHS